MFRILLFILSLSLAGTTAFAQLSITSATSQQVANKITGSGVSVSNVSLNCASNAVGVFTGGGPTNLGLDSGAILTTGTTTGINATNSTTFISQGNNTPGNALLTSTSGATGCSVGYDACVLTFDLVPLCDTIRLKTIFASEEYNEYVGSSVNDVWGFYVSGPNPTGGNYTNLNIATIPGSTTPITINTVNNGLNSTYYRDNTVNPQPVVSAYDGFTTVLYHTLHVVPGSTYSLMLGIQDCGDGAFDSGVFLQADGISCPDTTLSITASETTICEGETVTLFGSGLVSYSWGPTGSTSPSIGPIVTATPSVTTTFYAQGNNINGVFYQDSITVNVIPQPVAGNLSITQQPTPGSNVVCAGDSATISLAGHSGANVTWLFSTDLNTWDTLTSGTSGTTSIQTGPLSTSTAYMVIVDNGPCLDTTAPVTISVVPSPIVNTTGAELCEGGTAQISATGGGTYQWIPSTDLDNPTSASPFVTPDTTRRYYVEVTNQFGCKTIDSLYVIVNPNPEVFGSSTPADCPLDNGTIRADSAHGQAPFAYSLDSVNFSQQNPITNLFAGNYVLYVQDDNGCIGSTPVNVAENMNLIASFTPDPVTGSVPLTVNFTNHSTGNITSYYWDFGNGTNSTDTDPLTEYTDHGTYVVVLTAYGAASHCFDTASFTIIAEGETEIAIPNVFSPNGDGVNDYFFVTGRNILNYSLQIFDRWGKKVYETTDPKAEWDGKRKSGAEASEGTYYFVISYDTLDGTTKTVNKYITLVR